MSRSAAAPAVDEEHFRLLTGFNDIFVAIAAILLLVALAWIGNSASLRIGPDGPSPMSGPLVAGAAWGLGEFFTRKRRMALPSIILLLAFVGGIFFAASLGLVLILGEALINRSEAWPPIIGASAAGLAALAAWVHWRRFRVPITVAAGVAATVALVLGLIASGLPVDQRENAMLGFALLLGIGVFLFAMWWDASDPRRETRRSDVAFWLHLLAAPLIVHPIFALLGLTTGEASIGEGLVVLAVYIVLGLAALAVDRRALLVSALAYVLYALSSLFERFGAVELNVAFTALVIGSALLLLSAFWHSARKAIVAPLPEALKARLPVLDRPAATPQPAS